MAAVGGHFFRMTGDRRHSGLGEPAVAQSVLLDLLEGLLAEVALHFAGMDRLAVYSIKDIIE